MSVRQALTSALLTWLKSPVPCSLIRNREAGGTIPAAQSPRTASVVTAGASPASVCTVRATTMRSAAWSVISAPSA
jgi:hypothetical protein